MSARRARGRPLVLVLPEVVAVPLPLLRLACYRATRAGRPLPPDWGPPAALAHLGDRRHQRSGRG